MANFRAQLLTSRNVLMDIASTKFGYDTSEYFGAGMHEVDAMYHTDQLDMTFDHYASTDKGTDNADGENRVATRVPADKRTYVKYLFRALNKAQFIAMIEELYSSKSFVHLTQEDTLIVVLVGSGVTAPVLGALSHIWNTAKKLVVAFDIRELQFNALDHDLQPKDIHVASSNKKKELTSRYKIRDDQFPEVSRNDIVARLLCARPGQIICYNRSSPTAISQWTYRIVVD